jgi:hypothetical protein
MHSHDPTRSTLFHPMMVTTFGAAAGTPASAS